MFCLLAGAESSVAIMSMIVDLLFWALNNAPPAQVRIICAAEDKNFQKLIRGLYRRSYDVVIMTISSTFADSPNFTKSGPYPTSTTYDDESAHHHHLTNYRNSFLEQIQMPHHHHHNPSNNPGPKASLHVFNFPWPHQETEISMPACLTYKDVASRDRKSSCINLVTLVERGYKTAATNTNKITTTSSPRNSDENLATMEDVRSWLECFVASDKCLFGMDISLMAKSMEARLGKKLDLKMLGFPSLTKLLVATCADLVRLKHPSKDRTDMFPVKLCGEARVKMTADFHLLLAEILPKKNDTFPLSHVKSAFKAKFHYDLDHEAAGYSKLNQFVGSMPKLVRLHHSSSVLLNELVIQRPSRYWRNNKCEISSELITIITPKL